MVKEKKQHTVYKNKAGKRVPSCTTIISSNIGWSSRTLMAWQAKMFREGKDPDEFVDEACKIGTLTHSMIEHHIFGQDNFELEEGVTEFDVIKASAGLNNYIEWERCHNIVYLESELAMVSESDQTGGCCDAIAMVDGKCTLIDFKTSKSLYDIHVVQCAKYKNMIEEVTDYKIEQVIVIKIDKTVLEGDENGITVYHIPNEAIVEGLEVFNMARKLHNYNSSLGKVVRVLNK